MRTITQHLRSTRLALHVVAALAFIGSGLGTVAPALASRPAAAPAVARAAPPAIHAAAPPAPPLTTTCTSSAGTTTCDLYARTSTYTLPGGAGSVPIWGYAATSTDPAALPGPVLIANAGDTLVITLHNVDLPSATSLAISELAGVPDTAGVIAGNNTSYTYQPADLKPGTYLYGAGLTADGPRQAAMGLYGALIVRPTVCASCLYDANSTYDDEGLLVLSEIDPAFNAAPTTFYMPDYAPTYWLINGLAFSDTPEIGTAAGHKVALRYVNAGLKHHSMTMYGPSQALIAVDGKPAANVGHIVAQTIPTGETIDTIATVSASAPNGMAYPIFDAAMHMDNAGGLVTPGNANPGYTPIAFGGMLTFLRVSGTATGGNLPVTSHVALTPNPSNGSASVALSGDIASSNPPALAAEYFVDTQGGSGTGTAMTLNGGGTSASATVSTGALAALSSGNHTFYVHAQDANGWGVVASAVLNLDKTGPAVTNLVLTPSPTNGSVDVHLQATGSDVGTGGQDVTAAEYSIDGGAASPLNVSTPASTVSINGTIVSTTVAALSNGNHAISVRAQDVLGNWGALSTITLTVDKTGPGTSGVSTAPNPTNGLIGSIAGSIGQLYQRIDATVSDPIAGPAVVNSNIVAAEYFVDTIRANGTGGAMLANSGTFNVSPTAAVYGLIDFYAMSQITVGAHTISVHGKDAAGNWGLFATTALTVDKTGPNVSFTLAPNPNAGAAIMTMTATLTDPPNGAAPGSPIVAAEYFIGATDPGQGLGTPLTIAAPSSTVNLTKQLNVAGFLTGTYSISVRAQDAATNWGPLVTKPITINQASNSLFADSFESGNFAAWSATGGNPARISVTSGGTTSGTQKMVAQVSLGTSGYVQDNTPANEPNYHARFYISPTLTANTTYVNIFVGLTSANAPVFQVQLRRQGTNYQVQVVVYRAGNLTTTTSPPVVLTAGRWHSIEIGWQSTTNSSFRFYTDGVLRQTLTGLNTSTLKLDTVQLGPQPVGGFIPFGLTGTVWFDSFVSTRNTLVGP